MAEIPDSQILAELEAADDGLPMRTVQVWTLQKLATLYLYLPAFADACKKAKGGYYVDGMAGPGVGKIKGAKHKPFIVWGSPLLALRANPQLQRLIFMEAGPNKAKTLTSRCAQYAPRAIVRRGNVNGDLVPLLKAEVHPKAPCFCFLDPEGPELKWSTIAGIAKLPHRRRKPELMILFPLDMALLRLMPVKEPMPEQNRRTLNEMFATKAWWDIYQARLANEIQPHEARAAYLELYRSDLKALGYETVISRRVRAIRGPGLQQQERYHLFFATDHEVGKKIMRQVFDRPLDSMNLPVSQQPRLL